MYSSASFKVYNTVYGNKGDYYGDNVDIYNYSTSDPRLYACTAGGVGAGDLDEIAYFALGGGSSALGLADKSLITLEELLKNAEQFSEEEVAAWFRSVMTEEFLANVLLHDQIGNVRSFDGNRYDAGAVSGESGDARNTIANYTPKKAANSGRTSITFYGYGFHKDMKISLKRQGESDIVAQTIDVGNISKCSALFDVNNKRLGKWDIVVDFGGETITVKDGFEIETYKEPEIEVEILGSPNIRNGGVTTYTVKYTNKGNVPVYCQPIIVEIITRKEVRVEVMERWRTIHSEGVYTDRFATINGVIHKLDTLHDFRGANTYTTFITPVILHIPPYGTGHFTFDANLLFAGIADEPVEIRAYTLNPLAVVDPARGITMLKSGDTGKTLWGCLTTVAKIVWDVAKVPLGAIPGVGCAIQIGEALVSVAITEGSTEYKAANAAAEMGKTLAECATDVSCRS